MFPPHREIKPVLSGSSSSPERYGAFTEKRIKVYAKKETKFWAGDMNGDKNISGDQLRFSWHPSLFESRGITQVNLENVEKRKTSCETLKICYWNVIPAVGWTLPRLVGCHDWITVVFSYDDSSILQCERAIFRSDFERNHSAASSESFILPSDCELKTAKWWRAGFRCTTLRTKTTSYNPGGRSQTSSSCPSVSLREIIVDDRIMNATCGRTATNLNCEKASFLYNQVIDDKLSWTP